MFAVLEALISGPRGRSAPSGSRLQSCNEKDEGILKHGDAICVRCLCTFAGSVSSGRVEASSLGVFYKKKINLKRLL